MKKDVSKKAQQVAPEPGLAHTIKASPDSRGRREETSALGVEQIIRRRIMSPYSKSLSLDH